MRKEPDPAKLYPEVAALGGSRLPSTPLRPL